MASLTCFNRRFTPSWRMTIFAFLAILLFTRLGFWQLTRAAEKKQMLTSQANFAKQAPSPWQPDRAIPEQYQQITVRGEYLPQTLLLDNQHYQHQFGYHVLSPLLLCSNQVLLVDRGWVEGDRSRQQVPEIAIPVDAVQIAGYAYYPSTKQWVLGQTVEKSQANITIIERIDTKLIGQILHKSVYPFIIRLNKDASQGYVREWPVVAMPPERHYAYALQWFAMAVMVLLLYIAGGIVR